MAKITKVVYEVSACLPGAFSPSKTIIEVELGPNEYAVPDEMERGILDHYAEFNVHYAKKIGSAVNVDEQPQVTYQNNNPYQNQNSNQNFGGNGNNYGKGNSSHYGGTNNNSYGGNNYGGGNDIESLLNTPVPKGITRLTAQNQYGSVLRAANNTELNYIAYQCNKCANTKVAKAAAQLLQMGYTGV